MTARPRRVGVDGGHGSFVAGIHRLQHVEGFFAADLADDDAVGPHAQAVDQQLPLADGAVSFHVGRPGLQADDILLLDLQFGRVLNGDQAFGLRDVLREHVEKGRFAGAGTAGNQDADLARTAACKHLQHCRRNALQLEQLFRGECGRCRSGGSTATVRPAPAAE